MSKSFLPDGWKELEQLLDAALEREPLERPAFLDRACVGDTALRARLEQLLAECAHFDRLFASGAVEQFAALLAEPPHGLPETVAGRYRVGREIGAGGMATVYLARDLKHDRDVALKVLRGDLSAVMGSERFLAEVRITAKLDHPHILTLIDSGEADGMLFYVLPYVRGESLRAKLERERQLPIEDAVSIARQIASALDYAHSQGVVHRDIKPENILLQEGEAVLTDFGIALAVKEAGGTRLTDTGLSLGTPQYMSPEQATGDRVLDARSDIYSLAAVLYEMIAGEPPVTGATKQAMIAKLLTERPMKLGAVRDTVPESVDRAVLKALSKVPADRFATAGEFARALDAPVAAMPARRRSNGAILMAAGVVAAGALAAVLVRGKLGDSQHVGVTLRDRTQITFTGNVANPAISSDGKTLAYRTINCRISGCTFGIQLQDVTGAASQRLFDGASAIFGMEWSPDGRHLLFHGTVKPPFGTHVVSVLGDTPRRVSYNSTFFAGGDSLLSLRSPAATWMLVSGLDGLPHDSIHIEGTGVQGFAAIPRSKRIVVGSRMGSSWELRVIERDGRLVSRRMVDGVQRAEMHASSDAVWIGALGGAGYTPSKHSVMRIPLDAASGQLSSIVDTLYTGVLGWFSVTADGRFLVFDEGSTEFDLWGVDLSEAVREVYPEQKRLVHETNKLDVRLSPDGRRVLIGRGVGSIDARQHWSTIPFGGGVETPLALAAQRVIADWSDSVTAAIREDGTPAGFRLALVDVGTGVVREPLVLPDTQAGWYSRVPSGGWAWLTDDRPKGVRVRLPGDSSTRRIPVPPGLLSLLSVDASRNGRQLAFSGWTLHEDSVVVGVISLADGAVTHWLTIFGEGGDVEMLKDGTLLLRLRDTPETFSVHHLLGPGRVETLARIPRPVSSLSVSKDLKRAAVVARTHHGDAWMSRVVVRP